MNNHLRRSILILLITLLALWVALPQQFSTQINWQGKNYPINISRPVIKLGKLKLGDQWQLKTGLDIQGGSHLVFEADMSQIAQTDRESAIQATKENIVRRVDQFGISEPVIQTAKAGDRYRIIVELPGVHDTSQAIKLIGQTAQLEFRVPQASESGEIIYQPSGLTGEHLKLAQPGFDNQTGQPVVLIQFDEQGTELFAKLTQEYVGQRIAIFLDNQLVSDPEVREPITGGQAQISSSQFTSDIVKELTAQLNAGALPVGLKLVSQETIGASLGKVSIQKSIQAGLIGLGLVMLFMAVIYGKLGLLADVSLIVYAIITVALYKLLSITLTLPGITGFILSVGMAVDANILIFERYKEELWQHKNPMIAMELAFGRAWDSIRDANVATLITSLVLYSLTTSSVRGFAVTLGLGILISLFTGIIVTRTLIRQFYLPKLKS